MIYSGEFRDIQNQLYKVVITTSSGGNQTRTVTLGGTPFVTEMDSDTKTIYSPAKYQSATVRIITPDYNFDIYSAKAQGTKVELQDDSGGIIWTGYVTPNLYDMGFVEEREEVEIECIDALSTLQYIKYQSDNKGVVTFLDIIRKLLKSCRAYSHFYITNNIQLSKGGADTVLEKLFIAEDNFFDKKQDKETDEDVAWTMQEVLEEICQYLGVTVVADGSDVFFLDYDAIKAGNNDYYKYAVDTTEAPTLHTIAFSKTIKASDYSDTDGSLSLDNVYNKVTVTDDLYTFDTVLPSLFDGMINITKDNDDALSSQANKDAGTFGVAFKNDVTSYGSISKEANNMIVLCDKTDKAYNSVFVQYFTNPNYKFYRYRMEKDTTVTGSRMLGVEIPSATEFNYTDTQTYIGSYLARMAVKKLDSVDANALKNYTKEDGLEQLEELFSKNNVSSVKYENYLVFHNCNTHTQHLPNKIPYYPIFQTTLTSLSTLFGGANANLVITGSVAFHYKDTKPYLIPTGQLNVPNGDDKFYKSNSYIPARLQWGNLYWNGTEWTTSEADFKIPYLKDEPKMSEVICSSNDIINTVTWRIGTTETGYLIKCPTDEVIGGLPILTLYKPVDVYVNKYHNCVFFKDFDIKAIIGDPTFSDTNDSDTVYTNIINDSFVAELKDIKFRICTWDNKKPNYSAVAYKLNGAYRYLDKTFNNACYDGEQSWTSSDEDKPSAADGLRQEEHLIYKLVNQYSTPSIILNLSLRNDNKIYGLYADTTITKKDFIVDTINIDYKYNKADIKLIEKK